MSTKAEGTPTSTMMVGKKELMISEKVIKEKEALVEGESLKTIGATTRGPK